MGLELRVCSCGELVQGRGFGERRRGLGQEGSLVRRSSRLNLRILGEDLSKKLVLRLMMMMMFLVN